MMRLSAALTRLGAADNVAEDVADAVAGLTADAGSTAPSNVRKTGISVSSDVEAPIEVNAEN